MQIKTLESPFVKRELVVIDSWGFGDDITLKSEFRNKRTNDLMDLSYIGLSLEEAKQLVGALVGAIIRVQKIEDEYMSTFNELQNNMPKV